MRPFSPAAEKQPVSSAAASLVEAKENFTDFTHIGYEAPANNEFLIIAQPFRSAELSLAIARVRATAAGNPVANPMEEAIDLSQGTVEGG